MTDLTRFTNLANYEAAAAWLRIRNLSADIETKRRLMAQMAEAFHALEQEFGGHRHVMPDVGPTTACWTCDAIVRIQDSYSPKKDDRPFGERQSLCEDCFKALEVKGVAHGGIG